MFIKSTKTLNRIPGIITLCSVFLSLSISTQAYSASNDRDSVIKNIRNTINAYIKTENTPGIAVALINKDDIIYSEGFGYSNIETQQAVTADTSFWLGSVSKTAIAVSIMHAREQGLMTLDDNVNEVVQQQGNFKLDTPFTKPILVKHLVTHTSSIFDSAAYGCAYFVEQASGGHYSFENRFKGGNCDETAPVSLEGYLKNYLSGDGIYYSAKNNFLAVQPGSKVEYSNVAAALAGLTLQYKTGSSLADYAKTHIFAPLEMNNTSWLLSDLDRNNIAVPYMRDSTTNKMMPLPIYSLSTWPDGGLRSSANDLAKYLIMVSNDGEYKGTRILQEESIKTMLTPIVESGGIKGGVFWMIRTLANGQTLIGHDGADPGAMSAIDFDPNSKIGLTLVMNGIASEDINAELRHNALKTQLLDYAKQLSNISQ